MKYSLNQCDRYSEARLIHSFENTSEQGDLIHKTHRSWEGGVEQVDDVLVMGLKF